MGGLVPGALLFPYNASSNADFCCVDGLFFWTFDGNRGSEIWGDRDRSEYSYDSAPGDFISFWRINAFFGCSGMGISGRVLAGLSGETSVPGDCNYFFGYFDGKLCKSSVFKIDFSFDLRRERKI